MIEGWEEMYFGTKYGVDIRGRREDQQLGQSANKSLPMVLRCTINRPIERSTTG